MELISGMALQCVLNQKYPVCKKRQKYIEVKGGICLIN